MMSINALARGGYSAHGCWYDPRGNVIFVQAVSGETVQGTASFPSSINTIDVVNYGGVTADDPTISGSTMTFELSNFNAGSRVRYDVMLSTGEMRHLNMEVVGAPTRSTITDVGGDYGTFT